MHTPAAESRQMGRKHIFCVNGSPEFLDILREFFQSEHYNVTTTNYVPRTAALIEALQPDLIIIDLVVGQLAGWNLLQSLQQAAWMRSIPIVVTSTNRGLLNRVADDPRQYGVSAQYIKPLDLDVLLDTVHELIGPA